MKIIVITGSIGTGKSLVSNYLISKGLPLIDSDIMARVVVEKGSQGLDQLVKHFGQDILNEDDSLNRAKLGDYLFNDEASKETVNSILHPLIFAEIQARIENYRQAGSGLVFVDIPLYFEAKSQIETDEVWLVYVDGATQLERLMKRNNIDPAEAKNMIANQIPIEEKLKWADVLIDNMGSPEETYKLIDKELARLAL